MAGIESRAIELDAGDARLPADLAVPAAAQALVVFVHGSGSSRSSTRNRWVASVLQRGGFATLLFDLLTEREDRSPAARFDIALLTQRLRGVTACMRRDPSCSALPIGYFGASTGAAAALAAAADEDIFCVVSRGGRPDLAYESLPRVRAPTLLIVGGEDPDVLVLNRKAYAALRCPKRLAVVDRATHLFEEPGAMEQVATLASEWLSHALDLRSHDRERRGPVPS